MGLGSFLRSLVPGDDRQLAADIEAETRIRRSRSATRAARQGQKYDDNRSTWWNQPKR
ncbi:hypothetical protein [Streptomyces sp. NPDC051016]|uniref:hypothetical protein n=1 Tax=Streptomyces sp. NPDC051016 TaxID=3365638 RepID=UPI00379CC91C